MIHGRASLKMKVMTCVEGYDVRIIMKGLGEFDGIRRIFLDHIEETME